MIDEHSQTLSVQYLSERRSARIGVSEHFVRSYYGIYHTSGVAHSGVASMEQMEQLTPPPDCPRPIL